MISNVRYIWWDLDGTLYKMPPEFEKVKYQRRFQLYSKITKKPIGEGLKSEDMGLYRKHGSHSSVFMTLGKSKDFWQEEHQKIDLMPFIHPDKSTVDMFRAFETMRIGHSIFTNRKKAFVKKILSHLGINPKLFQHILTNEDVERPKPYPDGFRKMVKLTRPIPPQNILYVGDRVEADIIPAKKEKLLTALVWSAQRKTKANLTFRHVADVISLFR